MSNAQYTAHRRRSIRNNPCLTRRQVKPEDGIAICSNLKVSGEGVTREKIAKMTMKMAKQCKINMKSRAKKLHQNMLGLSRKGIPF